VIAALFLGESGGPRLLQADQGTHDDGVIVIARVETDAAGPGAGGEAIFPALFLVLTSDAAATVEIIPILSGENEDGTPFERELERQEILIEATDERMSVPHQFGLSEPLIQGGVEMGRWAPRGAWFRIRVIAMLHGPGDLILEGLGVEMEVVRESVRVPAPTPVTGS
jgi:hypothetical protein